MIASPFPKPAAGDDAPECGIAGHAAFEARLTAIAALRDRPAPAGGPALPSRFLRHADEQTVVGMHAMLDAIAALPGTVDLQEDAVVAASCQAGRLMAAKSLAQLKVGGAVTVSTHIVPQASLHSLAGAVSVALGMHGPHLGVSGGPDALAEGLVAAVTLARAAGVPRVWLVVTEWDEEPALDAAGGTVDDPLCRAVAMAIEPSAHTPLSLGIRFPQTPADAPAEGGQLAAFARALDMCGAGGALVSWTLTCPWGGEVRLARRRVVERLVREPAPQRLREAA